MSRRPLRNGSAAVEPPEWIKPQLTRLVDDPPACNEWLQEIKYDGYRMHARLAARSKAPSSLRVKSAYLDGELCTLNADGVPTFSRLQAAMDEGSTDDLVFFAFDLLHLNGESMAGLPLIERKERP